MHLKFAIIRSKLLVLVLCLNPFSSAFVPAQTIVKGKVTDIQTFEPVVFANVVFQGSGIGSVTDFDGSYTLTGKTISDSIIIVIVGYETKTIGIRPDIFQLVNVQLHPSLYALEEITVTPGENPAHILLRNVWKNNASNNIEKLSAYQYENYSRSTVFLRKFSYKPDDQRLFKPFSKEFDEHAVKTGEEGLPALPSYTSESYSDVYFLRSPKREFINIKAVNSEGVAFNNTELVSQLISKQENFYFPDNTVQIINKSFISPLSRYGLLYYKYYITDSLVLDSKYFCYEITVIPKREEDPVFHGTIWIHDTTYALKRISLEIGQKAELNFIKRIKIQQDYEPVASGAWFPIKTRFMADAVNIFITNYSEKTNIVVDKPVNPGFYNSELKMNLDAQDVGQDFWKLKRMNSYDRLDSISVHQIDSIKKIGKISVTAKIIEASIKGYYTFGWFEGGPYLLMYNYNDVEGSRFRLGGRTNISFSKKWILEGYLAYGLRDAHFKGSLQAEYFLSKKNWTKVGFQYRDDLETAGSSDEFFAQSSFLTFATTFGGSDKMAHSGLARWWIESDIFKGLSGRIIFTKKTFDPASPDFYFAYYTDNLKSQISNHYSISELSLTARYQPKATYVLDGMRRFPVNFNKAPVFSIEYYRGFKDVLQGSFNYNKFSADLYHNFTLGGMGAFIYDLRFTKILDPLPYPHLITLAGNQSFFRTNRTYNLMNYGEFICDEALEIFLSYHMDGLVLNKIPLIKKLQWRTVVSAHAAFGSLDEKRNGFYNASSNPQGILPVTDANNNPITSFHTLSYEKPYAELSYGIENILRFFRIDLVHRLTYLDYDDAHQFAVKISGVFRF